MDRVTTRTRPKDWCLTLGARYRVFWMAAMYAELSESMVFLDFPASSFEYVFHFFLGHYEVVEPSANAFPEPYS